MEYTDDANTFPDDSQEEIEAVDSLRGDLHSELNFRELFDEQLRQAADWQNTDKKYRRRLYVKLQDIYTLYVTAHSNPKRERLVEKKCDELNIANTKASHLSIRIVKLMLRPSDKTAYQYASVLRYSSLKDIAPDALAEQLSKKGNGIAELADRFGKEFPTHRRDSSDPGKRSMGPGDDDAAREADASNNDDGDDNDQGDDHNDNDGVGDNFEDVEEDKDGAALGHPKVDWGPKALNKWRETKINGGAWLFIRKLSEDRARIIKKDRPN